MVTVQPFLTHLGLIGNPEEFFGSIYRLHLVLWPLEKIFLFFSIFTFIKSIFIISWFCWSDLFKGSIKLSNCPSWKVEAFTDWIWLNCVFDFNAGAPVDFDRDVLTPCPVDTRQRAKKTIKYFQPFVIYNFFNWPYSAQVVFQR